MTWQSMIVETFDSKPQMLPHGGHLECTKVHLSPSSSCQDSSVWTPADAHFVCTTLEIGVSGKLKGDT